MLPDDVAAIRKATLDAVSAEPATAAVLARWARAGRLREGATVVALGKASAGMARAAVAHAPSGGWVFGLEGEDVGPLVGVRAGHPLPTAEASERAGEVLASLRNMGADSQLLCLVSGGGSAMFEVPRAGIALDRIGEITRVMMGAGADVRLLNAARRRLSQVKGGGLARAFAGEVLTVVIDDVPTASDPADVASGPTLTPRREPDLGAWVARFPELRVPAPKRLARPCFAVASSNADAVDAAAEAARQLGFEVHVAPPLRGEARAAGAELYARARSEGGLWVAGGEATVTVRGAGRGGRTLECVLGAFAGFDGGMVAAFTTDGVDGPSGAAGAFLDDQIASTLEVREVSRALAANDTAPLLERVAATWPAVATGTNVADVALAFHHRRDGSLGVLAESLHGEEDGVR